MCKYKFKIPLAFNTPISYYPFILKERGTFLGVYLKRKIDRVLREKHRSPLLIEGSKHIGKTESVRKFAKENYGSFIEMDFVRNYDYKSIRRLMFDVESIKKSISIMKPSVKFIDNDTLIFFDEIQACPEVMEAVRLLKEDGRYDVICASSELGFYESYNMYSIDFEEFLWAKGYDESIADSILEHMINSEPFSDAEYKTYTELFNEYILLGSMPEIVADYIENDSFEDIFRMQAKKLQRQREYIFDYSFKYDGMKVLSVYDRVHGQIANDNRKFNLSEVDKGARTREFTDRIRWLEKEGAVLRCNGLKSPEFPIKDNISEKNFRLYISDTGMLISSFEESFREYLRENRKSGDFGNGVYKNIVAEALTKQGLPLAFYRKTNSTLEADFLVESGRHIVPIEVKATNGHAKSMQFLVNGEQYRDIEFGIKLTNGNIESKKVEKTGLKKNNIYTFPYFTAFLIKRFLDENNK